MDIHLNTALKVHNLTIEEYNKLPISLQKQIRYLGKTVNYSIIYPSGTPEEMKQWLRRQGVM